jgi:hypothetical protein
MFPPREFWDRLPAWYRDFLYRYEADLPRMQAEHDALPRLTPEQVARLRWLLHGTPGTSCKHKNMRLSKGSCPDCGEWIGGKR